jgi:hypothetical protein
MTFPENGRNEAGPWQAICGLRLMVRAEPARHHRCGVGRVGAGAARACREILVSRAGALAHNPHAGNHPTGKDGR